jgi:hypothetical protein
MIRPATDEDRDPIDTGSRTVQAATPYTPIAATDTPAPALTPAASPAYTETVQAILAGQTPVQPAITVVDVPLPPRRTRRQEVTVQLATRVSIEARDLLDVIAERDGITVRSAVEHAIKAYARASG